MRIAADLYSRDEDHAGHRRSGSSRRHGARQVWVVRQMGAEVDHTRPTARRALATQAARSGAGAPCGERRTSMALLTVQQTVRLSSLAGCLRHAGRGATDQRHGRVSPPTSLRAEYRAGATPLRHGGRPGTGFRQPGDEGDAMWGGELPAWRSTPNRTNSGDGVWHEPDEANVRRSRMEHLQWRVHDQVSYTPDAWAARIKNRPIV
jgi:hypothetical protein